ncbi:MAG: tRNA threonylcarbamoyladenosine dehydratase [Barnesiella sp.]|nr:tRNA threonylcarbamoyladenosine dehydratase [Barnesiella sp.]MBD5257834.1 tRNA threonylcarbamoyladenosine dehydratase [Barnesiella sp.]
MNNVDLHQWESRTALLLGENAVARLRNARVIIFGMGGVGSWVAETLVRTGVYHLDIVDFDNVAPSNINRQLPALSTTVGQPKVEVMRQRLLSINPEAEIRAMNMLYTPDTADDFDFNSYDYVVDAIDSLRDKVLLIQRATASRCKFFSSMGAALKTDPTRIRVDEFWKAKGCRLAAALRSRFKRSGELPRKKFKVVYSDEIVENRGANIDEYSTDKINKPTTNGSLMQVTAPFGIVLASLVINHCASQQ